MCVCVIGAECRSAERGYANFPSGRLADFLRCWLCLRWTTRVVPSASLAQVQHQHCDSFDSLSLSHVDRQPGRPLDVTARKNTPTSCPLQDPPVSWQRRLTESADSEDSMSQLTHAEPTCSRWRPTHLTPDNRFVSDYQLTWWLPTHSAPDYRFPSENRLTWLQLTETIIIMMIISRCFSTWC